MEHNQRAYPCYASIRYSQLKDGRIVYHVKMTDGFNVNQASYDTDAEGNFYVTQAPHHQIQEVRGYGAIQHVLFP